jgi:hypothetical protein
MLNEVSFGLTLPIIHFVGPMPLDIFDKISKNSLNRKVYQFHLRTRMLTTVPYRLQNSWEEIFNVPIPWYRVYELIHKTTQDSRLRAFQLKLLYRILATKMLNIWGKNSSKRCRFCCEDTESMDHLFWYCPQACFWSQVQEWLKMHSIDLKLTIEIVLLGDLEISITNKLILLVKVFIFNMQSVDSI